MKHLAETETKKTGGKEPETPKNDSETPVNGTTQESTEETPEKVEKSTETPTDRAKKHNIKMHPSDFKKLESFASPDTPIETVVNNMVNSFSGALLEELTTTKEYLNEADRRNAELQSKLLQKDADNKGFIVTDPEQITLLNEIAARRVKAGVDKEALTTVEILLKSFFRADRLVNRDNAFYTGLKPSDIKPKS